jgi:hypothetical protein
MVKSGDQPTAKQLLNVLKSNWALKGKLLEFLDQVNWSKGS